MTRLADEPRVEDAVEPESESESDPANDEAPPNRRRTWAAIGGLVSLLYVVWYTVDLVVLDANPAWFTAAHRVYGNIAFRGVFAAVFLAIVFHGLDGLRVTVADVVPSLRRHDIGLRAAVRFLTFAVWIPATVILLWPAIREWFSR